MFVLLFTLRFTLSEGGPMTARCSKEQRLPLVKIIVVIITNIIVIISFLFTSGLHRKFIDDIVTSLDIKLYPIVRGI